METTAKTNNKAGTYAFLRELYRSFGYSRFKMNKFEEYDTYAKVKDFLISDRVITFTDTNGKLMAMKPDVTVSIIKNSEDDMAGVQKLYYNENVYRVSGGATDFREIMQTGLECIGEIDTVNICEVILLAAMSLAKISPDFVLDISHMGFVSELLSFFDFSAEEMTQALIAISEKNAPELTNLCDKKGISAEMTEKIVALVTIYGPLPKVIGQLNALCMNEEMQKATDALSAICDALSQCGLCDNVQLDFSVVNDLNYYNGIVFRGYIKGIPEGVLSGGQYDKLMKKMGKNARAIGFAIYLDQLERLAREQDGFDADVLLCYDDTCTPASILKAAQEIINAGKTVLVQRKDFAWVRCREKKVLTKGGTTVENG
ncbi:MAG: ATP phosphoribosyltransferase regulatory subunit [Clostridia bacterium]|nr:ATP phosphoribosyltransferase regulatory subunit [Clostridia bacterium]